MRSLYSHRPQFWLLHLILPSVLALLLTFAYPSTGLDAWLIQPFYDAQLQVFPLKQAWLLENVMHHGLKNLMVGISLITLLLWLVGLKLRTACVARSSKCTWIIAYHRQFLWTFVAMALATSAISILKHFNDNDCPWDLLLYGGTQPFFPLFGHLPLGAVAGHCFPGGHASGGFALMAFYFAFRDYLPKLARIALVVGLLFGFVMGYAQMMRGAHFLSHNLWTAYIVWMILLTQYLVWSPKIRAISA